MGFRHFDFRWIEFDLQPRLDKKTNPGLSVIQKIYQEVLRTYPCNTDLTEDLVSGLRPFDVDVPVALSPPHQS